MDSLPQHKKVLLIEDDFAISDLYKRLLSQAGFEVLTAYDGMAGLVAAQDRPNLILLDIMLPKMNGVEVLAKLKSLDNTKTIPVVLLTNLGQQEVVQKAYELGAQGYLLKMRVDPSKLIEYVTNYLQDPNYTMPFDMLVFD